MRSKTVAKIIFFAIIAVPAFVTAQTQATISINPNIPGVYNVSTTGPCGWVVNFYTFALIVSGILAFGAIVYGGFMYATSAGNASRQSEGRSWIWSALIGLLLLGGAYVILNTINPNLTSCQIASLSTINTSSGGSTANNSGGGVQPPKVNAPPPPASGNCASGPCIPLPNCAPVAGKVNCGAAQGMIDTMNCIQQNDPGLNYSVSEGYPPTVGHTSAGHNNGCSIDVRVNGGANTCADISALQAAAVKCGDSKPLNEYKSCGGTIYNTTTGNNVHINAIKGDGGC